MYEPEIKDLRPVVIDVAVNLPQLDNVLLAIGCGSEGYTVNTFLREDGTIHVGSILFATSTKHRGEIDLPYFGQDVPDLRAVVDLVRAWHAEHGPKS